MNLGRVDLRSVQYKRPSIESANDKYSMDGLSAEEFYTDEDNASEFLSIHSADTAVIPNIPLSPPAQDQVNQQYYTNALEALTSRLPRVSRPPRPRSYDVTMPPPVRSSMNIGTRVMRPTTQSMQYFYSGPPTPTNDDMPYLRYAIDQITREDDTRSSTLRGTSEESGAPYPEYPERSFKPDHIRSKNKDRNTTDNGPLPDIELGDGGDLTLPQPKFKYNPKDSLASLALPSSGSELYLAAEPPVHTARHPSLTFVPTTLRPLTLAALVLLSLLMVVGLALCITYTNSHHGLWTHTGSFNGKYFVFRFLPQIIAAALFLWIEGVMAAVGRIAPYVQMTSENHQARQKSLFLPFHPTILLWPRFSYFTSNQRVLGMSSVLIWPATLTIPLASCLFTVTNNNGVWKYSTVTRIALTLAIIYSFVVLGLIGIFITFVRRETGLLWDPRSLADIIALLPRSNCMDDYEGAEYISDQSELRKTLERRSDRLGYWRTTNLTQDIFYGIGEEGAPMRRYSPNRNPSAEIREKLRFSGDIEAQIGSSRPSYIPWYLRRSALILWPIAFGFLFVALLVVSFLPSIALSAGFRPLLSATPTSGSFIPSSFFYAFVPSVIGLALYASLRPLTHTIACLTPWSELARPEGCRALPSLLADYSASSSVPFAALFLAVENGHWLVALVTVVHPLTILLPVLGGGIFAAYTTFPSQALLVLTNLPAYYVIITLLIVYLAALVAVAIALVPWEEQERLKLPSSMSCLAEVISVVGQSGLRGDAAFSAVRGRTDLRTRLVGARERGRREVRYYCGEWKEGGRIGWGVERVGRSERL